MSVRHISLSWPTQNSWFLTSHLPSPNTCSFLLATSSSYCLNYLLVLCSVFIAPTPHPKYHYRKLSHTAARVVFLKPQIAIISHLRPSSNSQYSQKTIQTLFLRPLRLYYLAVTYIFDLISFYFLSYLVHAGQTGLPCVPPTLSVPLRFSSQPCTLLLWCVRCFAVAPCRSALRPESSSSPTNLARGDSICFYFVYLIVPEVILYFYKVVNF